MLTNTRAYQSAVPYNPALSLGLTEGALTVRVLHTQHEKMQGHRLRHRIFCDELGWVRGNGDALETDAYDKKAVCFGVCSGTGNMIAFLRLLLPEGPFMLEREFRSLVEPGFLIKKGPDTAEVSRLCIAPEARTERLGTAKNSYPVSLLLYKGVYQWCRGMGIRTLYMVVEYKIYRLLRAQNFPCVAVGAPSVMPDGVVAVACVMEWEHFEKLTAVRRPDLLSWFNQC